MYELDIKEAIRKIRAPSGMPGLIWIFDREDLNKLKVLASQRGA